MATVDSLIEAVQQFSESLTRRGFSINRIQSSIKPGNSRVFTNSGEVYHVKFTRKPFTPDADKRGPARELHLKLHFAMEQFEYRSGSQLLPSETGTMVGIDEDLILSLLDLSSSGHSTHVVTVLERGVVLWLEAQDFYEFVMRYDTFIKYPKSGVPVCYVPTGYFLSWADVNTAPPALVSST